MIYKIASGKISLRLFLIIPFLIQIFSAVGLIGYFSFKNGERAVNDLANQLEQEISSRVHQHLDRYLATPHQINQLNANAVELGKLDLRDFQGVGHYFWKQMSVFDVGYIYYVLSTGEYAGAGIFLEPNKVTIDELSTNTQHKANTYATDSQGNRTKLIKSYDNYHPQEEAAYTDAVKAGKAVWSQVYQWDNFPNIISISASYPLYTKTNKLVGVLVTNLRLAQISDFLRKLKVSSLGKAFVIERDGLVIASSSQEQPYTLSDGKAQRLNVINSTDFLIQSTATYLKKHYGDFRKIQSQQNLDFMLQGKRQFIQVAPWRDKFGLDWLVVVVVPETSFMEQIHANTQTTILLSFGALGVAAILGIFTSHWIVDPIRKLRIASQAIASGKIEQTVDFKGIEEIEALGQSFNHMAIQLESSFKELEIRVAQRTTELQQKNVDLEQALEELKRTQSHLIQVEKMSSLGQLIAGIAHEINNPINFIHGNINYAHDYIQSLLELIEIYQKECPIKTSLIDEKITNIDLNFITKDLIDIIKSMKLGTTRIQKIVLGLRNFSRLDEAIMKPVDIHEGIESTLMILQHRLLASDNWSKINIIKEYGKLPLVNCYASSLNQVFMNLLSNAIDALEEAKRHRSGDLELTLNSECPTIQISTELAGLNTVKICITDNGCGIDCEIQKKVFDPFFTTKPVGSGTGLGLSISYQIVVEKHGGRLYCHSTPGKGTCFVVEIPIAIATQ
uniref:histidine kinase n=1 Tax=Tolypothrix bouteillei VB521301 TaxID=1479485 RepID=A0A0C1NFX5_9CYAN